MDHRDKLLSLVKEKGPLLPSQINKEMKTNVLFASAMLGEMVGNKKLRLTSMKVGGSPLYYCEGQEHLLEKFAERLSPREKEAFQRIRSSKIIRDRDLPAEDRVTLRQINDFAIPLEVTANGKSDLFWKYYLLGDAEVNPLIRSFLESRMKSADNPKKEVQAKITSIEPAPEPEPVKQETAESVKRQDEMKKEKPDQASVSGQQSQLKPSVEPEKESSSVKKASAEENSSVHQINEKAAPLEFSPEFSYEPNVSFSTTIDTEEPVKIEKSAKEPEPKSEMFELPEDDDFFDEIRDFFDDAGIEIVEFETVRKGSEHDMIIDIPSNVGMLKYYCKSKSKAKINDGDLSSAFVQGQIRKLPILFVTSGELTKKAAELLSKEFRNMAFRKIKE